MKAAPMFRSSFSAPREKIILQPKQVIASSAKSSAPFRDPSLNPIPPRPKGATPRFDPNAENAVVMRRPDQAHQLLYNKKKHPLVDVVIDPFLGSHLREHQKEGVKFMYECVMGMKSEGQGCILADDMGLGKTIQAITLIWTLLQQDPYHKGQGAPPGVIQKALIVCPVTLVKNWKSEIHKWLGKDRMRVYVALGKDDVKRFVNNTHWHVMVIGYEKLRLAVDDLKGAQPPIGLLICDEGHRLKSAETKLNKALRQIATPRRIVLSGTPMQNDLGELHAMVDFVNPGQLDSYSTFKKVFESVILRSREPKANAKERQLGQARMEQLTRVSQSYILRRGAEAIEMFLPPRTDYTVFVTPTPLQLSLYSAILGGSAVRDLLSGGSGQLPLLMAMRLLCNSPGLVMKQAKDGKSPGIYTDAVTDLFPTDIHPNSMELSGKFLAIAGLIHAIYNAGEEKIVLVSNFTTTLDIFEAHCRKNSYPFCRLDGQTANQDRVPMVEGFNRGNFKNNFIFLLSSKSGGTGLNIIGASRLILVDSDWNPSSDMQAMARYDRSIPFLLCVSMFIEHPYHRIHRQGQLRHCYIYRFLTAGMVDEKIYQRQITKLGLSGSLLDAKGSGDFDKADAFTLDDLKSVFKLHATTTCQTHDLLSCKCQDQPMEVGSGGEDDIDEDFPTFDELRKGFIQASQYHPSDTEDKRQQKSLSILKSWVHHDCSIMDVVDEVEDPHLRLVIFEREGKAENDTEWSFRTRDDGPLMKGGMIGFAFSKRSGMALPDEEGSD
ncbi:hypothetical protein T439DRAFT_44310 [Meredithblackwellia eburnea MCA 4105]